MVQPDGGVLVACETSTFASQMFGVCLRATSVTADLTVGAACAVVNGVYWNAVSPITASIAHAISTGTVAATANLRFGFRAGTGQRVGQYVAPITFQVIAP